jgi:type IV pilus assembly protein PilC
MASYAYTARDKTGAIAKGNLFALDRASAVANLLEKGLVPILLKEEDLSGSKNKGVAGIVGIFGKLKFGNKIKLTDKVIFSRQFATMVNAGVPVAKSLAILKEQTTSKPFQIVIADLVKRVEGGTTLSAAMGAHPEVFSSVFVNMVAAGETGGILDEVLERLAVQQEKDAEIVGKVRGAMIYPGVITSVTIGAFVFLMTVIVPKLGAIFLDLGVDLPIYTKIMLGISNALTKYGIFVFAGFVAGFILISRYVHTPGGKKIFHALILKMPIFGPIISKVNIARFARTFGSLMTSGIAVLEALKATSSAVGNVVFKADLEHIAAEVKNGKPISEPMRASKLFPPIVSQMISVGEETGKLDEILLKLAEFYEKEVDSIVAGITSIIEPILIIVIGVIVGFIIVSVFGPLSQLSSAV